MADFRRCILALAVVALLTGVVSTASAAPFTCNATSAVPTLMRSEGLAELAGDIVLQCSGILPAGSVNSANINVFLGNTTITSRILNTSTNASEVLLLVDEPAAPFVAGTNMFQGIISGNQVMFLGVPVVPGGTLSTGADIASRVFRITNLRANASAVGTGASGTPGQVTAFVSIAGPTSIAVNNAQQTVGFVSKGLTFGLKNTVKSTKEGDQAGAGSPSSSSLTFVQCSGRGSTPRQNPIAAFRFTENFATAFKIRGDASQTVPGSIYNTESGLVVSSLASSGITGFTSVAGQADFGTRLRVVFNNIPNGLNIWVSQNNIWKDAPASAGDAGTPLVATAVVSETVGSGAGAVTPTNSFKNANGDSDKIPVIQVSLTGGAGTAVWEVVKANPIALDFADFYFYFGYSANPASNSPATGTGTVSGSFAPISTVATASATAPIPRFADTGSAVNVATIVACRTNLLFPFVTNQAGFDTGIAIANTSKDIFGTDAQAGTCTLNFFGDSAPAPVTSGSVAGGAVYTALAQSVAPGFQGYVIAQCGFQFGHGFAFVSDVGARNLAMGYLALVIPDQSDSSRSTKAVTIDSGTGELLGQ